MLKKSNRVDGKILYATHAGRPGSDGALISWNECVWQNLNSGLDYGMIAVSIVVISL